MADLNKLPNDRQKVYTSFLGYAKWATILIVLLLIGMALFLYNAPAPPAS